ncbi:hypothetical protein KXQ82_00790 [Mucilaginibacter sp. HMF5004]|uniref:hypothetical protein n=1 Tax=Mucilaginibacter rivuli TaxID=2857527 RepID=UPI001C5F5CFA|nr:hypothetical protein [Mucilaginibacter rivuli]MBW4888224.1 hypothetical protein [Mucilaginibacter rivuli]
MKKALIILLLVQASIFTANAQIGYNYAQWSLGTGISYLKGSTNVQSESSHPAFNFNLGYNVSPYISVTLDYQFGKLSGGYNEYYPKAVAALDITDPNYATMFQLLTKTYDLLDPYHLSYTNNFQKLNIYADVQLGEFMDYANDGIINKILKNIYVGSGVGLVFNSISDNNDRLSPDGTYYIGGSDNSQDVVIPLRVGYQHKIFNNYDMPSVLIEVGYQRNWVLGYGLDGYADPLVVKKTFEQFGGFNIGVKFNFGSITSYRRPIH